MLSAWQSAPPRSVGCGFPHRAESQAFRGFAETITGVPPPRFQGKTFSENSILCTRGREFVTENVAYPCAARSRLVCALAQGEQDLSFLIFLYEKCGSICRKRRCPRYRGVGSEFCRRKSNFPKGLSAGRCYRKRRLGGGGSWSGRRTLLCRSEMLYDWICRWWIAVDGVRSGSSLSVECTLPTRASEMFLGLPHLLKRRRDRVVIGRSPESVSARLSLTSSSSSKNRAVSHAARGSEPVGRREKQYIRVELQVRVQLVRTSCQLLDMLITG